jgi:hypothetical protein
MNLVVIGLKVSGCTQVFFFLSFKSIFDTLERVFIITDAFDEYNETGEQSSHIN